jgi:hypothetical protein
MRHEERGQGYHDIEKVRKHCITQRGVKKKHGTVPMFENKSSKSENGGGGKEGTKQRLNFGISTV